MKALIIAPTFEIYELVKFYLQKIAIRYRVAPKQKLDPKMCKTISKQKTVLGLIYLIVTKVRSNFWNPSRPTEAK